MTPTRLTLLVAVFLAVTGNFAFFDHVLQIYPWSGNAPFVVSTGVVLAAVFVFVIALLGLLLPVRLAVSILLLLAAGIGYFQDKLGIVIDSDMIRNMLETNVSEAGDLLNPGLLMRLALLGVLPVVILWWLPFWRSGRLRELRFSLQTAAGAVVVMLACIVAFGEAYASFFRNHKPLRYYTNPTYPVYSAIKYAAANRELVAGSFKALAAYAKRPFEDKERDLVILVVGETARADHFSLNGYPRETNPLLAREKELISYRHISSCGTATAISVPCMFAFASRSDFDVEEARQTENILDVLQKAGVDILWRDNNSSSKGVADRVHYEDFRSDKLNPVCDPECRDVGMLAGLQEYIDQQSGDVLIVLHQMGSHGPAYYKRYPAEFEAFTPACQSAELSECSVEEVVNAYDNTILYTDFFLSKVIELLKANSGKYETTLFYVSDHGESLGEGGIYLHGMPYLFAPESQVHVPWVAWVGPSSDFDYEASNRMKDAENSHDALTLALLNAFEVDTDLRERLGEADGLFSRKPEE